MSDPQVQHPEQAGETGRHDAGGKSLWVARCTP